MKKLVYIITFAAMIAGCAKNEPGPAGTTEPGTYSVTLPVTLSASLPNDVHTEPMTRAGGNTIVTRLTNKYKYFISKKVGDTWYADISGYGYLTGAGENADLEPVITDTFNDLTLELRPGEYHIVVFTNPRYVKHNNAIIPGTPVKRDDGTMEIPWLFQYTRGTEEWRQNYGLIGLNRDIFTASADFTVTKTGDLHSSPAGTPAQLNFTRINTWYRTLLREDSSLPTENQFNMGTAHFWTITMESLDAKGFPYGVDAWGNAWYPVPAEKELTFYVSSTGGGRMGKDDIIYNMPLPNATYFYPMLIADKDSAEGHRYKITYTRITAQGDRMGYYYFDPGKERVFRANTYSGIILEATEEVRQVDPLPQKASVIAREGAGTTGIDLFSEFYEWNN